MQQVLVGHMPYSALVAGPYGNVVAANDAFEVLTEGAAPELLTGQLNIWRPSPYAIPIPVSTN